MLQRFKHLAYFAPAAIALMLSGCAKQGRAWIVDNSPILDMLLEGWKFHFGGAIIAFLIWYWLRKSYNLRYTWTPFLAGLAVFVVLSAIGLFNGYAYINTPCAHGTAKSACPTYKEQLGQEQYRARWNSGAQ